MDEKETSQLACIDESMVKLNATLHDKRKELMDNRTAKLWMIYMQLNDIIKEFIRADRLGMWDLYLSTLQKMLPFFAASGHNNYTKCLMS